MPVHLFLDFSNSRELGEYAFVGLIVCYAFGTAWFMIVYSRANGAVGLATVLGWCVIPFIIPDIIKIVLAYGLSRKLRKFVA